MPRLSANGLTIGVCMVVTVGVLIALYYAPVDGIRWKENSTQFLQTLGALSLVAVFVERVVEVFVAIWQDPKVDLLQQQLEFHQAVQVDRRKDIQELQSKLTIPNQDESSRKHLHDSIRKKEADLESAEAAAEQNEKEMVGYRAGTRRLASWIAVVVGVLTAAVGFRILHNLVEIDASTASEQRRWLVVIDSLLTGAVLAGGSKAVHEIFNLYTTLMETSQSVLKKRELQQAPPVPAAGQAT